MRILLSILFCVFIANAIVPNGAIVTQSVTINSAYVSETSIHFRLQFKVPRTGIIAANCDSAKHVCMTGINDTIRVPRWVIFTTDTIYVYADGAVNTSVNTSYNLHFSKSFNEVNTSSAFTNCGITNYWGLNEGTGSTATDYAGGNSGTLTGNATWSNGQFYNGILNTTTGTSSYVIANAGPTKGKSAVTVNFVATAPSFTTNQVYFAERNATNRAIQVNIINDQLTVYVAGTVASNNYGALSSFSSYVTANTPFLMTVVFDGTLDKANRLKLYVNGTQRALTIASGGIPATTENVSGAALYLNGYTSTSNGGKMDECAIYGNAVTAGNITSLYNMLFSPTTFFTLGTPALNQVSGSTGTDTLRLVCSAENALTYQWYQNDTIKVGQTDSVLTIYADSLFYSKKQVIYCLVNGTEKSMTWTFDLIDMLNGLWNKVKMRLRAGFK